MLTQVIQLDARFKKKAAGMFGKYQFEVGVLEDRGYKKPKIGKRGLKGQDVISNYAGGPVRQKSAQSSGLTIAQVSAENRKRLGRNYLTEPFGRKSADIVEFTKSFFDLVFGRSQKKRAENLLQAIVRNPILRGEYGPSSPLTNKIKGFNRPMMDTAQLFKAIKAVCRVKRV